MDRKVTCQECSKKAFYREKSGELFCQEHHDKGREKSYKTYTGDDWVTNNTYINCPHCGMGDTCGTDGCFVYRRCCGLLVNGDCPGCKEERETEKKRKLENKNQEQVDKYDEWKKEIELITISNLTVEDYKKIKELQNKVENLLKEKNENEELELSVASLKNQLEELEKNAPARVKVRVEFLNRNKSCPHYNVGWKRLEGEDPYCLDCGDNESNNFLRRLQLYHQERIDNWLKEHNLNSYKLGKELPRFERIYDKLTSGYFSVSLELIQGAYLEIEKQLEEITYSRNLPKTRIVLERGKDREREREREREQNQSLLQYFTTNSIDSIRLDNNKLFIKYNHKAEEEEEPNSSELQQIKDYLDTIPSKSISKSELESKSKQDSSLGKENKGSNLGLVIGLGIGGIFILLLVLILMRKKYHK